MKKKTSLVLGFMIVIFLVVSSGLSAQITYTVGTGGSYDYITITAAIAAASNGDIIDVYGTITEEGITVDKGLTIQGQDQSSTIVQAHATAGSASDRVFEITSVDSVVIKDMTIQNGNSSGDGGAVYMNDVSTLNHCTLNGNIGRYGGAVNFNGGGILNNCTLNGNTGRYGGAVYFDGGGTLNDCIINGNSSEYHGGGTYLYYGGIMNNCTLTNNSNPDYEGGAAYIDNGGVLTNCTLSNNTAGWGGGVFIAYIGTLNNCLLNGNSAWWGGGSYLYYGGTLNNCTLSNNSAINADSKGGGAYLDHDYQWLQYYDESILSNCILWENTVESTLPEDGNDIHIGLDGTVLFTCASDGLVDGVDGCIIDDPLFEDPVSNDYHLQASSPCIDTGNNVYVVGSYDLEGNDRIQNGTVDMGAYEGGGSGIPSPENVIITFDSGTVSIIWDEVSGATSYIIYSSDDPYDNFTEDISGIFVGESWSASIGDAKKFYYVTAIGN